MANSHAPLGKGLGGSSWSVSGAGFARRSDSVVQGAYHSSVHPSADKAPIVCRSTKVILRSTHI
jgi:hypothetical protein